MPKKTVQTKQFQGFSAPNYTQVPDELFDDLMVDLSGAELKVLLYIIRRTFGFKKAVDNISLSQLLYGIKTRDGEVLDKGTGLSKKTLLTALKVLVIKNIIITERRRSVERGNEPTAYRLNINNLASSRVEERQEVKITPTLGVKTTPRASSNNSPIQETVLQQTDLQIRNSSIKMQSSTSNTNRKDSQFKAIGEMIKKKIDVKEDVVQEIPEQIKATIDEISHEFGERRNSRSNLTHVMRIFQRSGKALQIFNSYLYEARSITKQQGSVKKKMPYFFSVLEDISGVNTKHRFSF